MKYAQLLFTQFKAFNTRERLLLVAALLGTLYFLFDFALFRPQQAQARQLREQISQREIEVEALNKAVVSLSSTQRSDPLDRQREELAQLRTTFSRADSLIAQASSNARMAEVVRTLVATRPGLTLVSLKTLPAEVFFKVAAAAAPAASAASAARAAQPVPVPTLYKHGMEVTVQGSYVTLLPYLRELERNANGIFWHSVKLDVKSYPDATLKITLYTLSASPELPLG